VLEERNGSQFSSGESLTFDVTLCRLILGGIVYRCGGKTRWIEVCCGCDNSIDHLILDPKRKSSKSVIDKGQTWTRVGNWELAGGERGVR